MDGIVLDSGLAKIGDNPYLNQMRQNVDFRIYEVQSIVACFVNKISY